MQTARKEDKFQENLQNGIKKSLPEGCVPELHPQQQEFIFDELTLDSHFDSGNLAFATKQADSHFNIWVSPDCSGTSSETGHRSWFYFRVRNVKQNGCYAYTFTIKNIGSQMKLFTEGLLPVYRAFPSSPEWKRIKPQPLSIQTYEKGLEISFNHILNLSDEETYFAFTYPWSYTEDQAQLDRYEKELRNDPEVYFHRELLAYSREQRRIELLTISSHSNKIALHDKVLPDLFPEKSLNPRPNLFSNKKYVFITSRVHPGETPASYSFNALLKFLLSKDDQRAKVFRDNFVMVLIPMLNPDGVYRGHYRVDTHGLNLNRFYLNPNITEHPSIYAAKEIMLELNNSKRLFLYCDLHAHAGKKGCFVYGNKLNFKQQVESRLFPKLLSLNSEFFEYDSCSFSENNTKLKDKNDGDDKEGAGRVALFKATNFANCYTLECNYNSGSTRNILPKPTGINIEQETLMKGKSLTKLPREEEKEGHRSFSPSMNFPEKQPSFESYTSHVFEEVGAAIGPALLDMIELNPFSRVKGSPYKNLKNIKLHLATTVMKDPIFRVTVYLGKQPKVSETPVKAKITRDPSLMKKKSLVENKVTKTQKTTVKKKITTQCVVLKKETIRFSRSTK